MAVIIGPNLAHVQVCHSLCAVGNLIRLKNWHWMPVWSNPTVASTCELHLLPRACSRPLDPASHSHWHLWWRDLPSGWISAARAGDPRLELSCVYSQLLHSETLDPCPQGCFPSSPQSHCVQRDFSSREYPVPPVNLRDCIAVIPSSPISPVDLSDRHLVLYSFFEVFCCNR